MLVEVLSRDEVSALARHRRRNWETRTVRSSEIDAALAEGWSIKKKSSQSVRLIRSKSPATLLHDRVWSLLYRLGFSALSVRPVLLKPGASGENAPELDIVGVDDEVAIAILCKAADKPTRWRGFEAEIGQFSTIRQGFANAIHSRFPRQFRRPVILAVFLSNLHVSVAEKARAKELNVILFDVQDLEYYEHLTSHLDEAAKYQLLADMLPGKQIPGLTIRVPAIRAKIGGFACYSFSISPAYLLKIAYVSHRAKGNSDVSTYQRMLTKSRLNKIRQYISDDGVFPTNIVLNLDGRQTTFDRVQQQASGQEDADGGVLGWLSIRPAYKSAWIIDGQHRLFAYSGHERAKSGRLSVLAFEGLPASTQAKLFIDINAKQKSVRQSLLQELYADLKWDSDEPGSRVAAIISRAVQELNNDPDSPFFHRIQTTDASRSDVRCISLPSLFNALEKGGFYINRERNGQIVEYGALGSSSNDIALQRTVFVLNKWFDLIRTAVPDWWALGSGVGGGIAMNDGVNACLNVLRSVYQHLETTGMRLADLSEEALARSVEPYGNALGEYLAALSEQERKKFRELRGNQGLTTRTRRLQVALRERLPEFEPAGLQEFLDLEREQTNVRAKEIVDRIEVGLHKYIFEELKIEFGPEESQWWIEGVPKAVRLKATGRFEDDDGKRGGKEFYVDLIDYRSIILHNWPLFGATMGFGSGNKDKKTSWMNFLNDKRRIVAHASSGKTISLDELAQLEEYDAWFSAQMRDPGVEEGEEQEELEAVAAEG